MNGRRSFIKGFGLLGAFVGGSGAAHAASNAFSKGSGSVLSGDGSTVHSQPVEHCPDISHLAPPDSAHVLQINGSYGPPPPPPPPGSLYCFNVPTQHTNHVKMTVGKDNRLWIKVDDTWRRVALEG